MQALGTSSRTQMGAKQVSLVALCKYDQDSANKTLTREHFLGESSSLFILLFLSVFLWYECWAPSTANLSFLSVGKISISVYHCVVAEHNYIQ